jgi:hypothetical protein
MFALKVGPFALIIIYMKVIENNCFITGPFTAFIPTDAAFQKIPAPILQKL